MPVSVAYLRRSSSSDGSSPKGNGQLSYAMQLGPCVIASRYERSSRGRPSRPL